MNDRREKTGGMKERWEQWIQTAPMADPAEQNGQREAYRRQKKVAEQLINFSFKFQLKYGQTLDSEAFT